MCAAPKGNKFWELAPTTGRKKLYATPELLWKDCVEYFEATKKRKWVKTEYKSEDGKLKKLLIPTAVPFTIIGLCIFLGMDDSTWQTYGSAESHKDFHVIVRQVEKIIYNQKFEGAVVGAFKENIIARELGLADKHDNKHSGEISTSVTINRIIKKNEPNP